ncbi:MAG: hypothetical protein IJL63_02145 [Clostridia bacterium]|nr:hypothetical protein [Clostridia bacterium]
MNFKDNFPIMPEQFHNALISALDEAESLGSAPERRVGAKRLAAVLASVLVVLISVVSLSAVFKDGQRQKLPVSDATTEPVPYTVTERETTGEAVQTTEAESTTQEASTVGETHQTTIKAPPATKPSALPVTKENDVTTVPASSELTVLDYLAGSLTSGGSSAASVSAGVPQTDSTQSLLPRLLSDEYIAVLLDEEHSAKDLVHSPEEFPGVKIDSITNVRLWNSRPDSDRVQQLLLIKLSEKGADNVAQAISVLNSTPGVVLALPCYQGVETVIR